MALELVKNVGIFRNPPNWAGYQLNGRVWTQSSDGQMWKDSVLYCAERNTKLQTLGDAVEFRHDSNGADNSNEYQHTGTLIGIVNDGKAGTRAFIWEPDSETLEMLARYPQITNSYLPLKADDPLVGKVKGFAESSGRTFIIPKKDLELSVQSDASGNSVYSQHKVVGYLMGAGNAQKNAAVIFKNGYPNGIIRFERPDLSKGDMWVCPLRLGGNGCYHIYNVDAYDGFSNVGRSRGVASAQKISP